MKYRIVKWNNHEEYFVQRKALGFWFNCTEYDAAEDVKNNRFFDSQKSAEQWIHRHTIMPPRKLVICQEIEVV